MKITEIEVGEIFVPLAKPFKTALRTVENVEDIVVRITTDTGAAGYGEAPPTAVITGDTKGSIRCAIEDFIRPALLGMEIEDLDGIMYRLHSSIVKNTSAKAAVDMAVYDLYAQRFGAPLYQLLGGAGDTVETDITISVNPVPQMVADSLEAVQQGYKILKIKAVSYTHLVIFVGRIFCGRYLIQCLHDADPAVPGTAQIVLTHIDSDTHYPCFFSGGAVELRVVAVHF